MKFRKLNFWSGVITATIITFAFACNNDKSEKTSTAKETSTDTTSKMSSTTPSKKKGKVTVTMASNKTDAGMKKDKMGYYNATETAPVFQGGQSDLENYITNHIEYPQEAVDNNAEGVVNVQFTIDENGKVGNVKTIGNKIGYGLEDAAVQVVSQMPKWKPGQIKEKNVKAWYTLPIVYKMES